MEDVHGQSEDGILLATSEPATSEEPVPASFIDDDPNSEIGPSSALDVCDSTEVGQVEVDNTNISVAAANFTDEQPEDDKALLVTSEVSTSSEKEDVKPERLMVESKESTFTISDEQPVPTLAIEDSPSDEADEFPEQSEVSSPEEETKTEGYLPSSDDGKEGIKDRIAAWEGVSKSNNPNVTGAIDEEEAEEASSAPTETMENLTRDQLLMVDAEDVLSQDISRSNNRNITGATDEEEAEEASSAPTETMENLTRDPLSMVDTEDMLSQDEESGETDPEVLIFSKSAETELTVDTYSDDSPSEHPCFNREAKAVVVSFQDLSYSVKTSETEECKVLKHLSGCFGSGMLTAVSGPSDNSIRHMLSALAGKNLPGKVSGRILYNGENVSTVDTCTSEYVEKFDTLIGEMTVEGILRYTADIKLSAEASENPDAMVEEVLQILDLESCRGQQIGNPGNRGISDVQSKKLNIGLALISRPSVLFLDEPTSGLDSASARQIMELLHRLAHKCNHTVVCSVPSPKQEAFEKFDDLCVVHRGEIIFQGTLAKALPCLIQNTSRQEEDKMLMGWLSSLRNTFDTMGSSHPASVQVMTNLCLPSVSFGESTTPSSGNMPRKATIDREMPSHLCPEKDENIQTGVVVTFENVSYKVMIRKNDSLTILKELNGAFVPGRLTALMGPSGSGKSTLLDVLAGRKNSGNLSGRILYNGKKPKRNDYRSAVGYVEQFDTLVEELTVENMLRYTAALKLPANMNQDEREARVEEVIKMLDLESCRKTVIGNSLSRGISGGQAKRVNIGLALITRPPVLFLDEPTSGLDSRVANEVIELLRQLAHEGNRTIVCTIHSPTGHAFSLFEDLYMIHKGETIYEGNLNYAQTYFEELGNIRDPDASLPEWLVDLTSDLKSIQNRKSFVLNTEASAASSLFADLFKKSALKSASDNYRCKLLEAQEDKSLKKLVQTRSEFQKLMVLLYYRTGGHLKSPKFLGPRFGAKILFGLLTISLYWGIGSNVDPQSIFSTSSLLFFTCALCGFGAAAFVPTLNLERALFYRELADGCYSPATYYFSKFIEEAVVALFSSFAFVVMVFYGVQLTGTLQIFFAVYYLATLLGVILAYAFSAAIESLEAANALLPIYVTFCLYFGGLYIVFDKIPAGWEWFSWTSFMRYAWAAFMLDNYSNSLQATVPVFFDDEGMPQSVLDFYGMTEGPMMNSITNCILLLFAILSFFTVVGVCSLVYIRHDKR